METNGSIFDAINDLIGSIGDVLKDLGVGGGSGSGSTVNVGTPPPSTQATGISFTTLAIVGVAAFVIAKNSK